MISILFFLYISLHLEERFHKFFWSENLKIVNAFTDSNIFHRNFELIADSDHHTAFGSAVELGYGESVNLCGCHKLACLLKSILSGGAVKHEKDLLGASGTTLFITFLIFVSSFMSPILL